METRETSDNVETVSVTPRNPVIAFLGNPTPRGGGLRRKLSALGLQMPAVFRGAKLPEPLVAPILRTQRLVIRPHQLSDADAWFAIQSDAGVLRFLSWPARNRLQSLQHLKDRTKHTRLAQADDLLALAIEFDGALVGDLSVHLRTVHPDFRSAEIGWLLASARGGAGLATEAVCAVIEMLFDRLELQWVFAFVDSRNEKSLALALRLGFTEITQSGHDLTMMMTRTDRTACQRHSPTSAPAPA